MRSNVTGFEQFLENFGQITLAKAIGFALAIIFCIKVYQQVKNFLNKKKKMLIQQHELEQQKEEQLHDVLEQVNQYPAYREQSRKIQKEFRDEIDGLKKEQEVLTKIQQEICDSLNETKEKNERRERNKLRNLLLQSYRYYTDKEKNPEQVWTKIDAETFWELFSDYEDMGGDGYIHTVVQPAMNLLTVIDGM